MLELKCILAPMMPYCLIIHALAIFEIFVVHLFSTKNGYLLIISVGSKFKNSLVSKFEPDFRSFDLSIIIMLVNKHICQGG